MPAQIHPVSPEAYAAWLAITEKAFELADLLGQPVPFAQDDATELARQLAPMLDTLRDVMDDVAPTVLD